MENKFLELFKEILEVEDAEISLEDKFRDYEEWGSLAHLSVIAMLDEEFNVSIEDKEFTELLTLKDLIEAIKIKTK